MGYRVFTDSQGVEWQTWDVIPHLADRRTTERRSAAALAAATEAERRRADRRRVSTGRRPVLSAGLDAGWLCFEAPAQKRRLTPIPADWLRCNDECLERYCREARPAAKSAVAIDISSLADFQN